ncbi:putative membrane domain protein [Anaplasma phagocytophilum str. CRT53-1]|uniref:Putative membrane domain protein n=1 Tax=Anaplasma phagocytophilum str. CRT53-1 TaxID=1359157 RepID=A0A0F3Q5J7_ANAPH|nr:putative membrane domain protein [Anaplasma phagocytophilum str. CRT53-1]
MLPACFGLLCDFFLQQKKGQHCQFEGAGVTAHVLLINTVINSRYNLPFGQVLI